MNTETKPIKDSVTSDKKPIYNGIRLPEVWPPRTVDPMSDAVIRPPYLLSSREGGYRPEVIDITVGRQLFVDDFLIEQTDLSVEYHQARKFEGNPIFRTETEAECTGHHCVGTGSGGIWYDMENKIYKMWYDIGFNPMLGYAESRDGIHWERKNVADDGSNVILKQEQKDGACSVFIDYDAVPSERYKMFLQSFHNHQSKLDYAWYVPENSLDENNYAHMLLVSADGIHWTQKGGYSKGLSGDMTTAYYDALQHKWINSLRSYARTMYCGKSFVGRVRYYAEHDNFEGLLDWKREEAPFWQKCDREDPIDRESGVPPQLYNFDAIAYESILVGMWQIWRGPENHIIMKTGNPKITELIASYSRDGFYFDRPERTALIPATRQDGCWDKGYIHCANGGMIVHNDTIDIYYSGFSGFLPDGTKSAHADQAIGIATLRRDGFASLNGNGCVLTRKLTVHRNKKYLFVNIDAPEDSVRAEILDGDGNVPDGFSMDECIAVGGNSTCRMIKWKSGKDLTFLNDNVFRIRFSFEKGGKFYAFWLSGNENGTSDGAVAAGYAP